ncbi:glycoside hydrolase family 43 protein [Neolentinus lepideus HHB14362 ss-1]|uniref:Glycoside hydrolase family 43 protein n=1 Tax=Neolentinus lepideus HHB14362 ss-1 TaxID=1314782 RepID=A0A165MGB7_9AGAM|nr:glycoside hydrolase family 43 protein [Neolentinus lepideus HHB14362 ss-1]
MAKVLLRLACILASLADVGFTTWTPIRPYKDPIIPGFNPDPSCTRVGDQFYCVNSSFNSFPGIPVYTSRDLINWEQIGKLIICNVLSRPEQLPQMAQIYGFTSGIWASTIRYNNGTFYVTTTLVWDKFAQDDPMRWDNMMFTTRNIYGDNWSDPVHFSPGFQGYDVSLFWDDDGKTYVQGSHAWHVLPGIWQYEIDLSNGTIWNPEVLWTGTGGIAPEGPHVYKRDGYYYLLIAEGGTGLNHMVTMARSNGSIHGPYEPCAHNPVLTNANTTEYLQTVGHADVFEDTEGNVWAVALATRNGTWDYPMGRETVLVAVAWEKDQYPLFNPFDPIRVTVDMAGPLPPPRPIPDGGTLVGHDQAITFSANEPLPRQLVYLRLPTPSSYILSPPSHPNSLCLLGSAANLTGPDGMSGTSTFVGRRQEHVEFTSDVILQFEPGQVGEEAGITVFLQQLQHFDLGVVSLNSTAERYIRLKTTTKNSTDGDMSDPLSLPGLVKLPESAGDSLKLKVQAVDASTYVFSYAEEGLRKPEWNVVGYGDASEVSGGFTGTIIGMYATGNGRNSTTSACFSTFSYRGVLNGYV